jgi:TonB-dependent SusC/RagA subfamily outer membrane receptor
MNSLLYYLLQVIAVSGLLYLYYHIALRNKKFHLYNRFYLLAAIPVSILVPFLDIPVYFTPQERESSFVLQSLSVLSSSGETDMPSLLTARGTIDHGFNPADLLFYGYILLGTFVLARIIISVLKIRKLSRHYPVERIGDINFVNTKEPSTPFSFFRWLFWHQSIELNSDKGEQIFRHELYHIRQRHSFDIIFMELTTVVFWINPFFHLIKKEMRAIHEFLADRFAVNENQKWDYAELLLMQVLQTRQPLVNPFFHNQIKRRIAMITNPKKTSYKYLRKLFVLPLAALIVTLFAFKYKSLNHTSPVPANEAMIVVIDAGHGGSDAGAKSPDGSYTEAQLTLQLAKKIQELSSAYNINVVMTREDEAFPDNAANKDEGLRKRIEIAEKANPAAFISIHVSASPGKEFQENHSGIGAYVTSNLNAERGKKVASAILSELSTIYKTSLDPASRNDRGIWVLDKNKYPSVLIECGYINNRNDLNFITDASNQEKLAHGILRGIVAFANNKTSAGLNAVVTDSVPDNSVGAKSMEFSGNINVPELRFTVDRLILKGDINNFKTAPDLIIVNGEKLGKEQAIEKFNGTVVKDGEMSVIPADNSEAMDKFGEKAKNGVLVFENTLITKNFTGEITKDTTQNPWEKALVVIDGIPFEGTSSKKALENVNPDEIESITVLKSSAAAIYGSRGKDGVLLITLRNPKKITEDNPAEIIRDTTASRNTQNFKKLIIQNPEKKVSTTPQQRRQDIAEIKAIARDKHEIGYVYKGRTYLFSNKEATSFIEMDGVGYTFLVNETLSLTLEEINKRFTREQAPRLTIVPPMYNIKYIP